MEKEGRLYYAKGNNLKPLKIIILIDLNSSRNTITGREKICKYVIFPDRTEILFIFVFVPYSFLIFTEFRQKVLYRHITLNKQGQTISFHRVFPWENGFYK